MRVAESASLLRNFSKQRRLSLQIVQSTDNIDSMSQGNGRAGPKDLCEYKRSDSGTIILD